MKTKQVEHVIMNAAVAALALHKNNLLVATKGETPLLEFVSEIYDVLDLSSDIAVMATRLLKILSETGGDEITITPFDPGKHEYEPTREVCRICGEDANNEIHNTEGNHE